MQKSTLYIVVAIIAILIIGGVYAFLSQSPVHDTMIETDTDSMMPEDDLMMEEDSDKTLVLPQTLVSSSPIISPTEEEISPQSPTQEVQPLETQLAYNGTYLSGGNSPVIDFNQADFDDATTAGKTIVLYYYASWCPICQAEIPRFYNAMKEINNPQLVGFRVNFNDSDTDESERSLARAHGVAYQHTKVVLQNSERILKSPQSWSEEDYLSQLPPLIK